MVAAVSAVKFFAAVPWLSLKQVALLHARLRAAVRALHALRNGGMGR